MKDEKIQELTANFVHDLYRQYKKEDKLPPSENTLPEIYESTQKVIIPYELQLLGSEDVEALGVCTYCVIFSF